MNVTSASDDAEEHIAAINIIPLVDVVLVLLIIFLVTAVFTKETAMKVDLPKEASQHAVSTPLEIVVNVDKDAHITVNGKPTEIADLQRTILTYHSADPSRKDLVVLRGDKAASYGAIVPILDNISRTGIPVTIAMKPQGADH
ncbi:MAG TPA: biopolymer transporter ExbD [Capsulimonadaceae bacterium]